MNSFIKISTKRLGIIYLFLCAALLACNHTPSPSATIQAFSKDMALGNVKKAAKYFDNYQKGDSLLIVAILSQALSLKMIKSYSITSERINDDGNVAIVTTQLNYTSGINKEVRVKMVLADDGWKFVPPKQKP